MDRRSKALLMAPALLVALGCTQAGEEVSMAAADIEAVNQVRELEVAALGSEVMADLPTVYTDDVMFMPPSEPALMGQEASQAWFEEFVALFDVNLEYTSSDVTVAGDWAIERYTGTVVLTPEDGGDALTETIKGIHIYQRQADGSWKIAQDIWNYDEAPSSGE